MRLNICDHLDLLNKNYSVYVHINKINSKRYIGITSVDLDKRWMNGKGYIRNNAFFNDILAYGWMNFEHVVISSKLSKSDAENMESRLIKEYNTTDTRFGYNILPGVGRFCKGVYKIVNSKNESEFIDWINSKWLLPIGATKDIIEKYKIYKEEDKDEIVNQAIKCHLYEIRKDRYTFVKIIKTMEDDLGYEVVSGRQTIDGGRVSYKLILSWDENSIGESKGVINN